MTLSIRKPKIIIPRCINVNVYGTLKMVTSSLIPLPLRGGPIILPLNLSWLTSGLTNRVWQKWCYASLGQTFKWTGSFCLGFLEVSCHVRRQIALRPLCCEEFKPHGVALKDNMLCGERGQGALRSRLYEWRSHLGRWPSSPTRPSWYHTDQRWTAQLNSSKIPASQNQEQNEMLF